MNHLFLSCPAAYLIGAAFVIDFINARYSLTLSTQSLRVGMKSSCLGVGSFGSALLIS